MPKFKHDCEKCIFLDTTDNTDLYYCGKARETIIARWSSDGPDYHSMPISVLKTIVGIKQDPLRILQKGYAKAKIKKLTF